MGDVVVLASPPRDPLRSNTASGDASERCTCAAPRCLLLPRSSKYGGETDWIYNATARCKWWRVSAAGLRLRAVGREREEGSRAARVVEEVCVGGRGRTSPLYIEGVAAASPSPSSKPISSLNDLNLSPYLEILSLDLNELNLSRIGWALWGLVPLAQCGQETPS